MNVLRQASVVVPCRNLTTTELPANSVVTTNNQLPTTNQLTLAARRERLIQIPHNVFDVFQTHAQAYEVGRHTRALLFIR